MTVTAATYTVLPLAPKLKESVFQARIIDLAAELRVGWHHETDSRRTREGWLDLFLCGDGGASVVELKTDDIARSRLTDGQAEWAARLVASRQPLPVGVWRPQDWPFIHCAMHRLAGRRVPVIPEAQGLTRHRLRFTAADPHGRAGVVTGDCSTRLDADTVRKALPDPTQAEVVACDSHGRPLAQEQT